MWQVFKDDKPVGQPYSEPGKCAAEILVRGWYEPIEYRYGVVWIRGVEIRKIA